MVLMPSASLLSPSIIFNMERRAFIVGLAVAGLGAAGATAQQKRSVQTPDTSQEEPPVEFVCPMHPDVHSSQPGLCPRCGMALVANLPDRIEYPLSLKLNPAGIRAGQELQLSFTVNDPSTGKQVTDFQVIHEKLYHLFIVSQDLK